MDPTLPVIGIGTNQDQTGLPLATAWELSVLGCWTNGAIIHTQYDRESDPPSRDINVRIVIDLNIEPFFHRAMPGGFYDNEMYVAEVIEGVHDHWIDPKAGKWQYTYHERIECYQVSGIENPITQLDAVVDALASTTHSRRIQISIWKPWDDLGINDPACLQRMWFRIFNYDGDEKTGDLVMACYIRSNDAFKAAWMNMYAFLEIGFEVAKRVSEDIEGNIRFSQYIHSADSYHIYGSYFEDFRGFLQTLEDREFEDRTWTREEASVHVNNARVEVLAKLQKQLDNVGEDVANQFAKKITMLPCRYGGYPYSLKGVE